MDLAEARAMLVAAEKTLERERYVVAHEFNRNGRCLELVLTARLIRTLRRSKIARSKEVLTALKNASYGFDSAKMRSEAGRDGIYVLDRDYVPANEMMRKIFDRFLDRDDGEARDLAAYLELPLSKLVPVRLVSHHMRLLGVLAQYDDRDALALVDFDDTK